MPMHFFCLVVFNHLHAHSISVSNFDYMVQSLHIWNHNNFRNFFFACCLLYWALEWPLAVSLNVLQFSTYFIRDRHNFCPSINWENSWKAPCVFITDDKLHTSWPIILKIILRHTLHKKNNTYQVCLVSLLWFLRLKECLAGFLHKENVNKFLVRALFRLRRFPTKQECDRVPFRALVCLRQFWFDFHVYVCDSSSTNALCSATVLVRLSRQPKGTCRKMRQKALVRKALQGSCKKSAPSCKTALDVITNNRMFVLHVVF